ncbi:MAG: OsmC family peroxiredoxin [Chloroflexota bacterium]|nr:MAG: OsmC family peroxiredoxin [Chloroflexota bacterium]
MAICYAEAAWEGSLREGKGDLRLGSGAFEGQFSYLSRFEEGAGTNPEELIGAAHAACFNMSVSSALGRSGFTPTRIETKAAVTFEKVDGKNTISQIHLQTRAEVPGIERQAFLDIAETAKQNCPVSRALAGVNITLEAELVESLPG